jgi:hypothetical protein
MLGFYDAYQTHGIPLSNLISVARERRIVPSWVDSSFDPERVEQTKIRLQRLSA